MLISPSLLSADFGRLNDEVEMLNRSNADMIHLDVMDGVFVPNISFGFPVIEAVAKIASKPLDVHLMIEHPNNNIHIFLEKLRKGDTVYIHPEAEYHPSTTLQKIINAGMTPGIAINPGTSIETVMEMLRIVRKVLVMSVNPGNAGQMYLPYVGKKITKLLSIKEDMDFELYWDGACSAGRILEYAPRGVKGFVLGTTLLFGKDKTYMETLQNIRHTTTISTSWRYPILLQQMQNP